MSNLTISEKTAFDKLPTSLREFTVARVETPFKELNQFQQKSGALEVITTAFIDLNTTFKNKEEESDIKTFQTNFLIKELSGQYGSLTLTEIKRAFYMGVRNEFNTEKEKWYSMCPASYHFFLKKYFNLPQRTEGMKQYLEIVKAENKVELTPEEKNQKNKEACIWCFNEYKETKQIPNGHFKFYQTLLDLGLIKWTQEEKKAISSPIKAQYEKELETSKKRGHISTSQLAELLITLDSNPTLISRVRKVALAKYFDSLIAEKKELKDLIK